MAAIIPAVELLDFDSDLFGFKVGRLDLSSVSNSMNESGDENRDDSVTKVAGLNAKDTGALVSASASASRALAEANAQGFRLVYIFGPLVKCGALNSPDVSHASSLGSALVPGSAAKSPSIPTPDSGPPLPGFSVDCKTTYSITDSSLALLRKQAEGALAALAAQPDPAFRIVALPKSTNPPSAALHKLAMESGVWSRFKVDPWLAESNYQAMYSKIIENSLNHTIADVVWVAYDSETGAEIGFLSAKLKDSGKTGVGCFLAVSTEHRRLGLAKLFVYTLVRWLPSHATCFTLDTQARNEPARKLYDLLGLRVVSTQQVHHAWLPQHLLEPKSIGDRNPIPFCKQFVAPNQLDYVSQVMNTGLDSAARFTFQATAQLQTLLGPDCTRVVMTPSGTAALELAAILCELKQGDEVIMPSYTFTSTANAFVLRGAVPVFADIREDTLNIDERLIEAAISERTKAICVVHYTGVPCEMDAICAIAGRYGLKVIEDAAQAVGSFYKGRPLGTIGDIGCFSFHYTKNVSCGEGGAVSINRSNALANRALVIQEKGTNRYDFLSGKVDRYEWVDVGSSYVPSEISCAVLSAQLEAVAEITSVRLANFKYYLDNLSDLADKGYFRIPRIPVECQGNGHIFFLVFRNPSIRDHFSGCLDRAGITAFKHYLPLHSAPAGRKYGRVVGELKVTDCVATGLLRLPVWAGLKREELDKVVRVVRRVCGEIGLPDQR